MSRPEAMREVCNMLARTLEEDLEEDGVMFGDGPDFDWTPETLEAGREVLAELKQRASAKGGDGGG